MTFVYPHLDMTYVYHRLSMTFVYRRFFHHLGMTFLFHRLDMTFYVKAIKTSKVYPISDKKLNQWSLLHHIVIVFCSNFYY